MTVLLITIVVIFALLMFPLNVHITKKETPLVVLSWFLFKKQLFPSIEKEKKKTKTEKKKKNTKKSKTLEPKSKLTFTKLKEYTQLASEISEKLIPPVKKIIKRTEVKNLELTVNVASEDAFSTAINFAKVNVAVYAIVNILDSVFTLTVKNIMVNPDFIAEKTSYQCDVWVKLRPFYMLIGGINIAFVALCQAVKSSSKQKAKQTSPIKKDLANKK